MTSPVIIQATAKQTATVIFLHGLGDTGHGWSSSFDEIKKPHVKYIFPTAPIRPVSLNGGFPMNSWFDIRGLSANAPQDEEGIKQSAQSLLKIAHDEIKNGIPAERIFVGGFSQGGATALYAALTGPHRFAGVIALSTWLPLHTTFPAALDKSNANKLSTPVLQCQGDADPMVPLAWAQMSHQFLKSMGFTDLLFKTYSGLGHGATEQEMVDIADFIHKKAH